MSRKTRKIVIYILVIAMILPVLLSGISMFGG